MVDEKKEQVIVNENLPIPKRPRVVIFGARASGSYDLAEDLKAYLVTHGIENPFVDPAKYVESIEHVMFGVKTDQELTSDEDERKKGLPKGVIVLPYMRQITPGSDMTIPTGTSDEGFISSRNHGNPYTPYEYIKSICDKYGVPIIPIAEEYTRETQQSVEQQFHKFLGPGEEK